MKARASKRLLAALAVAIAASAAAAPAGASVQNYDFRSYKGQYCRLTTVNDASGTSGHKTIHFSDSFICTRTMDQIAIDSRLDGGGHHFGPYGGGCLWPSCGTTRMTYDKTVTNQPSSVYRHQTKLLLVLAYVDRDFWIVADERAACTYTGISATSMAIQCTLIEPIVAEP
jgi:hypothetical protein